MPITRLYTTSLLPTGPLPDCILLFVYPQATYQTVFYCSATNRLIIRLYTTVLLPTLPITRLYTTVLLPTGPLPDCILLFCYQKTHNQTVNYCSATHRQITRLYTSVLLPICPLPDCILLSCYQLAHYQTVYYWSATKRPIIRLKLLFCYKQVQCQTLYH